MTLGTFGSTLNDELNRLANGGTYRDSSAMVDEALAAKQWANRENISPYSTDTVGVLNEIAGVGLDKRNWLDFNGICNYIGGTSGLPAAAALRQIYPTTDLLTGVASYYVDATTPRYNYPGYLYFTGVSGLSTPDATALDITGNIDLRARIAPDDWTPAATGFIFAKWTGGSNYSYVFSLESNGTLGFFYSTDGTVGTANFKYSTVATGVADGATKWVRVTRSSSTGNIIFYLSDDGSTWTQLGTTVTSTASSMFSGTANLGIMINSAGSTENVVGRIYNAQIFASINDTDKRLDVDLTTNVTSATYNQFTATTGQLVTINGQDTLTNGGTAGSLLPTTVGSSLAADSNDPIFLAHTGTNYVYLPGTSSNFMTVPDAANLDITGDIDIRGYIVLDDWTPAAISTVFAKSDVATQHSYAFQVVSAGNLSLTWSTDGVWSTRITKNSTVIPTITDGVGLWIRATLDVDNGASGNDVKFFTSTDGTTWTQLGSTVTTAGVTSIYSGTSVVNIAALNSANQLLVGKFYRAQIYSDITETTKVLDVDTSVITAGAATSFTAVTGQTVTINRSTSGRKTVAVTQPTWLFGTDDYMEVNNRYMAHSTSDENYVYLSGASGNYMSVSDSPPLDIAGDLDLQVRVALDDWTPGTGSCLLSKSNATGNQRSYFLGITTGGILQLTTSPDGSTLLTRSCTVATSITDGTVKWVRATIDVDNGASGNDVKFFTSNDGSTWTQLGATVTSVGTTSIFNSTTPVEVGSRTNGTIEVSKGAFYRAIIKNGIDGTTVLDADASVITLPSQTTFVDRSSNAYTVTINKSGVGTFVSTGNYLYLPGIASNYASTPDAAALDIVGDIDLRVKVALDDWTSTYQLLSKWVSGSNQRSYRFFVQADGKLVFSNSTDGLAVTVRTSTSSVAPTVTDGSTLWVRVTCDVDNGTLGNDVKFFTSDDGLTWVQLGTTVTTLGITSIFAGTGIAEIGTQDGGGNNPARGKFFRAQVLNGIGGTLVFDANFENSITSLLQTSFTESSTNAATVTINRSGSTFRSAGVIDAGYLYPGATNTFSNSTTDFLNFGATDSFTVLGLFRQWANPTTFGSYITVKDMNSSSTAGWAYFNNSGSVFASNIGDNTNNAQTANTSIVSGTFYQMGFVVNRSTQRVSSILNSSIGTGVNTSSVGSLTIPTNLLRIGRNNGSINYYQDFEFVGAAVFRTALTDTQIRQVSNYFANREVYL